MRFQFLDDLEMSYWQKIQVAYFQTIFLASNEQNYKNLIAKALL